MVTAQTRHLGSIPNMPGRLEHYLPRDYRSADLGDITWSYTQKDRDVYLALREMHLYSNKSGVRTQDPFHPISKEQRFFSHPLEAEGSNYLSSVYKWRKHTVLISCRWGETCQLHREIPWAFIAAWYSSCINIFLDPDVSSIVFIHTQMYMCIHRYQSHNYTSRLTS